MSFKNRLIYSISYIITLYWLIISQGFIFRKLFLRFRFIHQFCQAIIFKYSLNLFKLSNGNFFRPPTFLEDCLSMRCTSLAFFTCRQRLSTWARSMHSLLYLPKCNSSVLQDMENQPGQMIGLGVERHCEDQKHINTNLANMFLSEEPWDSSKQKFTKHAGLSRCLHVISMLQ